MPTPAIQTEQATDSPLQVAFCPYFEDNPYQGSLAAALEKQGVHVEGVRPTTLIASRGGSAVQQADILHLHWLDHALLANSLSKTFSKGCVFLLQLAWLKLRGKRVVWTVHNLTSHESKRPQTELRLLRRVASVADRVLVHSNAAGKLAQQQYKFPTAKLRVVPHANYIDDYPAAPPRDNARRAIGVPQDELVFLFLGAIRPYKGLEALLSALRTLPDAGIRVLIVGKPLNSSIDETLRAAAERDGRVDYRPGFVPDEEVSTYMSAADVVVLPYRRVLTSGSTLLAASFAKPIIVPNVESIKEGLDPEGIIVFDTDQDPTLALADAMTTAIQQRMELAHMGQRNFDRVVAWGWTEMGAATAAVYRELLPSSHRSTEQAER
ncbi:glycosyltransferase family 4 protein [Aeoliella sp.]|uniref:glycosyltransferase family 4 protein n=1 Tax=Aeoliella sp. TaxID=2795800 RepID=UPI003CCB7FEF